jgi:hypothetical protein
VFEALDDGKITIEWAPLLTGQKGSSRPQKFLLCVIHGSEQMLLKLTAAVEKETAKAMSPMTGDV